MVQSQKYSNQPTSIDLTKPDTQNNHLETRLFQLNHAISMELWQEAYKAVEDIYGLMSMSKTKTKPGQMYNYYSKLSLIFWKAGNHLFHAATLQKLFVLLKEQKKTITADELTKISTRLLLATLAIPIPPNRSSIDECLDQDEVTQEKLKRLSSLLNLQQPPTRLSLLKDLAKYNVVQHVFPEVRDLYKWLEIEFHPLKLSERVTKCLDSIESREDLKSENYAQYIQAIKEIAVTRLVKQISQVYTSIEIKRFVKLAPAGIPVFHLEKLIVDAAKQLDLQVRINHQTKSLHFGNDLYVAQKEDLPEGPTIQSMPSEQIRNQLITMSEALQQAQELIYGNENKAKRDELAQAIAHVYKQSCEKHHIDLLRRKQLIEEQKEMYERIVSEREQAEQLEKKQKQEEKDRIIFNQNMKNMKEMKQADRRNEILAEIEMNNEKEDDEVKKQIELANKEKKELMKRLKKEEEKFDHFIRACHENEVSLWLKFADEDAVNRTKFWEEKELERIENLKNERKIQAENRDRLLRMKTDKEKFENIIHAARREEYEKKMAEFNVKLAAAREAKLAERKEKRKQDRRTAYFKEIEDRKKREEEERKKREDEERRRKADEQAEKQRQRERDIELKLQRQQPEREPETSERDKPAPYRPKAAGGSGFVKPIAAEKSHGEDSWRRNIEDQENIGRDNRDRGDKPKKVVDEDRNDWRREPPRERRIDDEDRGGRGGGSGGFQRSDRGDRTGGGGGGGMGTRGGRIGAGGNKFESKADSTDSWRRREEPK